MKLAEPIGDWIQANLHAIWAWCNQLTYQEWFLVMGLAAGFGFLCMRGFGSRSKY